MPFVDSTLRALKATREIELLFTNFTNEPQLSDISTEVIDIISNANLSKVTVRTVF